MTTKAPSPSLQNWETKAFWFQPLPCIQSPLVNAAININRLDAKGPLCLAGIECFLRLLAQSTKHKVWADSPSAPEDARRKTAPLKASLAQDRQNTRIRSRLWSYKPVPLEKDAGGFLSLLASITCVCQVKTQPSVLLYHNSLAASVFLAD